MYHSRSDGMDERLPIDDELLCLMFFGVVGRKATMHRAKRLTAMALKSTITFFHGEDLDKLRCNQVRIKYLLTEN